MNTRISENEDKSKEGRENPIWTLDISKIIILIRLPNGIAINVDMSEYIKDEKERI